MVDRGAHIDLFFRNGFKEFEVLPPSDAWDSIKPAIRRKKKSFLILRAAAVVAVIVSLGTVSFLFTRNLSDKFNGPAISLNQETIPEGTYVAKAEPVTAVIHEETPGLFAVNVSDNINSGASDEEVYFKRDEIKLFALIVKESSLQRNINSDSFNSLKLTETKSSSGIEISFEPEDQGNVKSDKISGRWSIGAIATPAYYSRFTNDKNDAAISLIKSEKAAASYSGGFAFSYIVNKRISLQTGLYFSSLGQKVSGISSFSGFHNFYDAKNGSVFMVQTSSGTISSFNNDIFLTDNSTGTRVLTRYTIDVFDPYKADLKYIDNSLHQNFNYLEIPFLLKYRVIDRKIDFNLVGGISYNLLVGNSVYSFAGGAKYYIGKTEGLSPITFSSSLGIGMEYNLSGKISLNLEPTFRYYMTPVGVLIGGSSIHQYSFGILSGFSYKF
jgi:hypothetical protein